MKAIAKVFFLFAILLFLGSNSFAQSGKKCPMHHKSGHCDSTKFDMPGVKVHNLGNDSVVVYIDKSKMHNFNFGSFPFHRKKDQYRGHWAGVELGWNMYVTPDFNMNFPPSQQYMNLNTARSLMVNLNPFELNVNLWKNHIGFTTGLGFQLNNYYFSDNYVMLKDSAVLVAYQIKDEHGNYVTLKQNKLFNSYLTLPILFEYQTNPRCRVNSFHVAIGVIGGLRLGSYTKQVYKNTDETYFLVDQSGRAVASYYIDQQVVRTYGSYHLSPFKLDATLRVGWSFLNLWATCSITQMFQAGKGPEVFPLNVGITLLGW
ncbi:MAG: outer membrane beta-barrel protein [bacterium]